ncbi:MAG: hypothetical protein ACRCV0_01095, partial [Brevinema sp.]
PRTEKGDTLNFDKEVTEASKSQNSLSSLISNIAKIEIFPQKLEHSGYIILCGTLIIFSISLLLVFFRMKKAIVETQKNSIALKNMATALFINQQNYEYKMLIDELHNATSVSDKENARIQLLNFMNSLCKEICETKDKEFAFTLGLAFLSKIQGRFLKMGDLQAGADYFRFFGEKSLKHNSEISGRTLIESIRKEFQRNSKNRKK